jgi:hypothetical protein
MLDRDEVDGLFDDDEERPRVATPAYGPAFARLKSL